MLITITMKNSQHEDTNLHNVLYNMLHNIKTYRSICDKIVTTQNMAISELLVQKETFADAL